MIFALVYGIVGIIKMRHHSVLFSSQKCVACALLIVLLKAEIVFSLQEQAKKCPEEVSQVHNSLQTVKWQSAGVKANEIVLSNPPCLDDFGNLITRTCSNQTWIPKTPATCVKTTTVDRRCPMNFQEIDTSCIYITEAKPWEDNYCIPEKIPEGHEPQQFLNESVRLPLKRFIKYGPYESILRGKNFGMPFNSASIPVDQADYFKKDCLVFNTSEGKIKPEYCTSMLKNICKFDKFAENPDCPQPCVSAGINSAKCYCKSQRTCPLPASVNTISDKNILSDLAGQEECFVGQSLTSNWGLEGFKPALSQNEWFYTKDDLQCTLCTVLLSRERSQRATELVLNFDENQRKLYLTIYSPENLLGLGNVDQIICFTDASTFELRKRLQIQKILSSADESYIVYEVSLEKYMGQYRCKAFQKPDSNEISSNTVIAYKTKNGHEYSLRLMLTGVCEKFICEKTSPIQYRHFVPPHITELFKGAKIRVMEIYYYDFYRLDFLLHISTETQSDVVDEFSAYEKELWKNGTNKDVKYFRSSEFCLPTITTSTSGKNLTWPLSSLHQMAIPKELCLQQNEMPVHRICAGDFLNGSYWADVNGDCQDDFQPSESTMYFHSLLNQTLDNSTVENMSSFMKKQPDLSILSIYYVALILERMFLSHQEGSFIDAKKSAVDITDELMNVNEAKLAEAQMMLNLTDVILDLVDDFLAASKVDAEGFLIQKDNLIVHINNPLMSNVSGVVVYSGSDGVMVGDIERNTTFDDVEYNRDVLLAVYVPEEILKEFEDGDVTVITTIFFNDRFFSSNYFKKPAGPIVSVTIPKYGIYLPGLLPILFKSAKNSSPECGFWDYGKNAIRKKGNWSTIGGNYSARSGDGSFFHTCQFSHLTHFALLVLDELDGTTQSNDFVLSILIYSSDCLSFSGISGIFITAFAFKKWRRKQGTVILLNLCLAIILEMILTLMPKFYTSPSCHFLGKFIHYVVISKFSWMLVYSFLQYMRFVKVFTVLPENIVLISLGFGWGVPLIPVSILAITQASKYSTVEYTFCYPTGLGFSLGVIAPIFTIIVINTFVFFTVIREVTTKTVESHGSKENVQKLQMQLATLLFFILGIPWMLLSLSTFVSINWLKMCLIYIFSFMSNMDGLILFLFYVVCNTETRKFWIEFFTKKNTMTISSSSKLSSFRT